MATATRLHRDSPKRRLKVEGGLSALGFAAGALHAYAVYPNTERGSVNLVVDEKVDRAVVGPPRWGLCGIVRQLK